LVVLCVAVNDDTVVVQFDAPDEDVNQCPAVMDIVGVALCEPFKEEPHLFVLQQRRLYPFPGKLGFEITLLYSIVKVLVNVMMMFNGSQ